MTAHLPTVYDDIPSQGRWRDHILDATSYPTEDECALACLASAGCGYYVYGADAADACRLGSFGSTSSVMTPGPGTAATVRAVNHYSRQPAPPLPAFSPSTASFKYSTAVWYVFLYATHDPGPAAGPGACESVCLVSAGPCHLAKEVGGVCHLGRFDHFGGAPVAAAADNFYSYITSDFGEKSA